MLLDDGLHAKVSDFGITKRNGKTSSSLGARLGAALGAHTTAVGTARYMAPEVLLSAEYSFPCDVYSFGMLLWELTHDRVVFRDFRGRRLQKFVTSKVVMNGVRPQLELDPSLEAIGPLITACWGGVPADRPTMEKLADELNTNRILHVY